MSLTRPRVVLEHRRAELVLSEWELLRDESGNGGVLSRGPAM